MGSGEGDLKPITVAMADAIAIVTTQLDATLRNVMEGAKGPNTQQHGVDALELLSVGFHNGLDAGGLGGAEHSVLSNGVLNNPGSGTHVQSKGRHVRPITDPMRTTLLDRLDKGLGILRKGVVVQGSIIGVRTEKLLKGCKVRRCRDSVDRSTFETGLTEVINPCGSTLEEGRWVQYHGVDLKGARAESVGTRGNIMVPSAKNVAIQGATGWVIKPFPPLVRLVNPGAQGVDIRELVSCRCKENEGLPPSFNVRR